jgi:hypothetical protein
LKRTPHINNNSFYKKSKLCWKTAICFMTCPIGYELAVACSKIIDSQLPDRPEGYTNARSSAKEFTHFLNTVEGSLSKLGTQIKIALAGIKQ